MAEAKPRVIRLRDEDSVALAIRKLDQGTEIEELNLTTGQEIPSGHKLAVKAIKKGEPITKYGQVIGFASEDIKVGCHVHTHNVEVKAFKRDYAFGSETKETEYLPEDQCATFQGYLRPDGQVGTRNYLGVLATVNCSAGVSHLLRRAISQEELAKFPNVDGIVALGHGSGCCLPPDSEALAQLRRTIAGFARHPNFAGVLLVGLGCEVNLVDTLVEKEELITGPRLRTLNIQDLGGTGKTVEKGAEILREMLIQANQQKRTPQPASKLKVGLECGGSDAYSGLTANPTLGAAMDILVKSGGTAVLSETPEIYGAEHLLTRRAVSREVGDKLVKRIRWWEEYTAQNGAQINNNPTPGNKAGGITTILEKSLGAVAKGGSTNLVDVLLYAEPITQKGFLFMDTPGYDVVSITGMAAGGANLICFTTGRGTVYGCEAVPTLKLASNSDIYNRLAEDMDVNCGTILEGETTIPEKGKELFELILETASGKQTKNEKWGFTGHDMVPWHLGAVL